LSGAALFFSSLHEPNSFTEYIIVRHSQPRIAGTPPLPTTPCPIPAAQPSSISATTTSRSQSHSSSCSTTRRTTTCALAASASPDWATGATLPAPPPPPQFPARVPLPARAHAPCSFSLVDAKAKGWLVGQGGVPNAPVSTRNLNYSLPDVRSMCGGALLHPMIYCNFHEGTRSRMRTSSRTAWTSGGTTRARPCECCAAPP
jgi:hypothetical protein